MSKITYEHECRACGLNWLEEYGIHDDPPDTCPECESADVYRCVTTSGAVHFKGAGWSPEGYSKTKPLEKYKGRLKLYDRKEDLKREMRGEAEAVELAKLKRQNEAAKRHLGPDAAVTQAEADRKIRKAGDEATER